MSVQEARVGDLGVTDRVKELLLIFPAERGLARNHLVAEDAVGPPVHRKTVPLTFNDLGVVEVGEGGREGGRRGRSEGKDFGKNLGASPCNNYIITLKPPKIPATISSASKG